MNKSLLVSKRKSSKIKLSFPRPKVKKTINFEGERSSQSAPQSKSDKFLNLHDSKINFDDEYDKASSDEINSEDELMNNPFKTKVNLNEKQDQRKASIEIELGSTPKNDQNENLINTQQFLNKDSQIVEDKSESSILQKQDEAKQVDEFLPLEIINDDLNPASSGYQPDDSQKNSNEQSEEQSEEQIEEQIDESQVDQQEENIERQQETDEIDPNANKQVI